MCRCGFSRTLPTTWLSTLLTPFIVTDTQTVNVELLDAPVRLSREADPEDMTSVAAPASGAGSQFGKQQKDAVKARRRQRWLDRQGPQPKLPLHIEVCLNVPYALVPA